MQSIDILDSTCGTCAASSPVSSCARNPKNIFQPHAKNFCACEAPTIHGIPALQRHIYTDRLLQSQHIFPLPAGPSARLVCCKTSDRKLYQHASPTRGKSSSGSQWTAAATDGKRRGSRFSPVLPTKKDGTGVENATPEQHQQDLLCLLLVLFSQLPAISEAQIY